MENLLINVDELKNKIEAILFIGGEDIKIKDIILDLIFVHRVVQPCYILKQHLMIKRRSFYVRKTIYPW